MLPWLCAAILSQEPVDPYLLAIPNADKVRIGFGWTDLKTGQPSSPDSVAKAARRHRFVMVGENHDNAEHHRAQAAIIEALVKDGRKVVVGFEMFTRDNQASLDGFTTKDWEFADFQTKNRSHTVQNGIQIRDGDALQQLKDEASSLIAPFFDVRENPRAKAFRLIGLRVEKLF